MGTFGGKQPRAGRPKGSTTRPRLSDFLNKEQVDALVGKAIELATTGNETMLKFILEQHFGKAIQPVEGDIKGNLTIKFDNSFHDTHDTTQPSKENSTE